MVEFYFSQTFQKFFSLLKLFLFCFAVTFIKFHSNNLFYPMMPRNPAGVINNNNNNIFNFIVIYCIVFYFIVLYCIILYFIFFHCIVLYFVLLYCIVMYCIVLYCVVLYSIV